MVGAPKASQSEESGEIFKCSLKSQFCNTFNIENPYSKDMIREQQLLGYSMDASDKFVVSAPVQVTSF